MWLLFAYFLCGPLLKAGFHWRWSRNRSRNQKPRAIRSSENQTDGVRSRTLTLLMIPLLMIKWKLHCRSRKQKRKNQPIARPGIEHWHWFIFPLLLAPPTMQFSLDHKRRSRKRNMKKWKRSDSSDSDSAKLMTPLTTPIFNFHQVIRSLVTPTMTPTLSLVKTSL